MSAALGTLVSFHIDGAIGACIVLAQALFFIVAFLFCTEAGNSSEYGVNSILFYMDQPVS